jgi:hypothetical protein
MPSLAIVLSSIAESRDEADAEWILWDMTSEFFDIDLMILSFLASRFRIMRILYAGD